MVDMNNITTDQLKEKLGKDWEKVLFWISLLMLLFVIALFVLSFLKAKEGALAKSTDAPRPRSLLNSQAFAFLGDIPLLDKNEKPFSYQKILQQKQPKKVEPKKVEKPPVVTPPVPTPPTPTPAATPVKPTKVLKMRYQDFKLIEYRGVTRSASGELLALISVFDSKTKETQELTVAPGDMIDNLTVGVVTSDMIMIIDKKNQEQSIMFQSSEKVVQE